MSWKVGASLTLQDDLEIDGHTIAKGTLGHVRYVNQHGVPTVNFSILVPVENHSHHRWEGDCLDCAAPVRSHDDFVVHDSLWRATVPEIRGRLHVRCFEKRLGRSLAPEDLKDCPLNQMLLEGVRIGQGK